MCWGVDLCVGTDHDAVANRDCERSARPPGFPGSIDSLGATSIKVQLGPMYTLSPKETLNPCHALSIVSQLSRVSRESLTYS